MSTHLTVNNMFSRSLLERRAIDSKINITDGFLALSSVKLYLLDKLQKLVVISKASNPKVNLLLATFFGKWKFYFSQK